MGVLFLFPPKPQTQNPLEGNMRNEKIWKDDEKLNLVDSASSVVMFPLPSLAWFTVWNVREKNPQELCHNTNKMNWQRSQTPEMFALCLSERGREECRWKEWGSTLFQFLGYIPQTVGTILQKSPPPASPPALSPPVLTRYEKMQSLESVTYVWERQSVGGNWGGMKICNLIWSSGGDC